MNWFNVAMRVLRMSQQIRRRLPAGTKIPPKAPGPDRLRLHLFSADFANAAEAEAFAFAGDEDRPTALNRSLTGAMIDTAEVEVVHGDIDTRLAEFLDPGEADDILLRMAGDNTLIIVTEHAFGGLPYDLNDTDRLTYLGPTLVDV